MDKADWEQADKEYQPNCGPTALAAITGLKLMDVCPLLPNFKERHYTNPKMMKAALEALGVTWHERLTKVDSALPQNHHLLTQYGLVRIQFDGPWYGKFAYHHTHWVAAVTFEITTSPGNAASLQYVFDINNPNGWNSRALWEKETMPQLMPKRGNGKWFATHRWEFTDNVAKSLSL